MLHQIQLSLNAIFLFVCLFVCFELTKKEIKNEQLKCQMGRGYDGVTRRSAMDCQRCGTVFI